MVKAWWSTYHLQINFDAKMVDSRYDRKLDGIELNKNAISYQTVLTLLKDYKLKKYGAIKYAPPNRDPKTDIK